MAMSSQQVLVSATDTTIYAATGPVNQVIVQGRSVGWAEASQYRNGVLLGSIQPINGPGSQASYSTLQAGDAIHAVSPAGMLVDVIVIV